MILGINDVLLLSLVVTVCVKLCYSCLGCCVALLRSGCRLCEWVWFLWRTDLDQTLCLFVVFWQLKNQKPIHSTDQLGSCSDLLFTPFNKRSSCFWRHLNKTNSYQINESVNRKESYISDRKIGKTMRETPKDKINTRGRSGVTVKNKQSLLGRVSGNFW